MRDGLCAAIATFTSVMQRKVTYAGGGVTPEDAQRLALAALQRRLALGQEMPAPHRRMQRWALAPVARR